MHQIGYLITHQMVLATDFGPTSPFLENSLGQSISEYETTRPSYVTPIREATAPLNEELFKSVRETMHRL